LYISDEHICRFIYILLLTGDLTGRSSSVKLTRILLAVKC